MNILERVIFGPPGGMFREFIGITTHIEPVDLSLYQKLLPKPFSMPDHPIVTFLVVDYIEVFPWPMTRYQEWAVLLKSMHDGEDGWHVMTMAVTKWVPMKGGRYLGFPKYVADKISLERAGDGWKGEGRHGGVLLLSAEFQPGISRPLTPWEKELAENESFFKGAIHLLVPPGQGPSAQKVTLDHVVPPNWAPELGMVRIKAHPSEPWAGLVPDGVLAPGTYNHFTGGVNLVAQRLNGTVPATARSPRHSREAAEAQVV